MKIYDTHFNANEWFIIVGCCLGLGLILFLPKRFSIKNSLVFFMCGVYSGFFFDHSLSVQPVNYYDVNDSSNYQFIDFISYLGFGPFSYFFFYLFDLLRPKIKYIPIYILVWSFFSIILEWCSHKLGVYHYRNGYTIYYSFAIYLLVLSCWCLLYFWVLSQKKRI